MLLTRKTMLPLLLASATLVGGCTTYESDDRLFASDTAIEASEPKVVEVPRGKATAFLQTAIRKAETDPKAQKFWYSGYVKNKILSRTTTSMFDGVVVSPDGYLVNARIAAEPFRYYRFQEKRYINRGANWMTAREEPLSLDVVKGYADWLPLMDDAIQLEDEKVLGTMCTPFQIKISGTEWLARATSPLLEPLRKELEKRSDLQEILRETTVKMTVWIGKEDELIHQYQTWIIVPIPGAGYMDQEVYFRFFKYDDAGIELAPPEEIEKYLLD